MVRKLRVTLLFIAFSLVFLTFAGQESEAQAAKDTQVRHMSVTGEIGKAKHGYVIRSEGPGTIFTVLNPDSSLDAYVKSGKMVDIEIRIVSGDNVNIEKMDGKVYPEMGKDTQVRHMSVTGEIGKVRHGYVIRSEGPGTIFTVLNPDSSLDTFVKSGKMVDIEIRIVSGDNVNIEKIDGKVYPEMGKDTQVRQMSLTGEIGKVRNGYVIRSEGPGTIFTVLNPDPSLDAYVKSGKMVDIEIRIVSGDNVNIEKIDGKNYP